MSSIQQHFAYVMKNGIARNNRFQLIIPLPPILQNKATNINQSKTSSFLADDVISLVQSFAGGQNETTRGLDLMVEQVELPGKSITTTDVRYNGDFYKVPYGVVYEAQQFIFRASRDMYEKNLIDEWMNAVFDPTTHEVAYMDDYVTNITINQLDEQDNIVYSVILKDAFPAMSPGIVLSNEDRDQWMRISCSFMYRKWVRAGEDEDRTNGLVDSLSQTPFGPLLTPILSNPAVSKGLEVFERETGVDLEGEAVNVYNQVDEIVRNTTGTSINKSVSMIEGIKSATESNNKITPTQKAKVIEIIDDTLKGLRS